MKSIYQNLFVAFLLLPLFSSAQDLSNFDTVAHYSLINTSVDLLGMQDTIELVNAPYAGVDGVYSNGNYIGGDPDSCYVHTPAMTALYEESFAVQVEFKLESLNSGSRFPIIICGEGWRYLGFELGSDNDWLIVFNNLSYQVPDLIPEAGKWYTLTLIHNSTAGKTFYYLDGMKIAERDGPLVRPSDDGNISNTNGGSGKTYKGYWRNMKVFESGQPFSAVSEAAFDTSLNLYPNPTTWGLQMETSAQDATEGHLIKVYTTDGKLQLSQRLDGNGGKLLFPATMQAGVYVILVQGQHGQVAHRRVLLQR